MEQPNHVPMLNDKTQGVCSFCRDTKDLAHLSVLYWIICSQPLLYLTLFIHLKDHFPLSTIALNGVLTMSCILALSGLLYKTLSCDCDIQFGSGKKQSYSLHNSGIWQTRKFSHSALACLESLPGGYILVALSGPSLLLLVAQTELLGQPVEQ